MRRGSRFLTGGRDFPTRSCVQSLPHLKRLTTDENIHHGVTGDGLIRNTHT